MRYLVLIIFFISSIFAASAQVGKLSSDPAQFIAEISPMMAATNNENAMKAASLFEMAWTSGNINETQKARIIKFAQEMQAKKMRTRPHFENYFGAVGSAVNVHLFSGAKLNQLLDVIDKTYEREDPKETEKFMGSLYRFLDSKTLYRDKSTALRMIGGDFSFEYRYGNEVDDEPEPKKAEPKKVTPPPAPKPAAPTKGKTATKKSEKPKNNGWDDWSGWDDETAKTDKADDGWGTVADTEVPQTSVNDGLTQGFIYSEQPILKGPVVVIKNADLLLVSQYDSVTIQKTSGLVSLNKNLFVGKGGKFAWALDGNEVTANLKKYNFNIAKSEFVAEGAELSFPALLEEPIEGVFEYKGRKRNTTADTGFPRFASFTNNARLKNLGEDINYRGGFTLAGAKIMSAALDNSLSTILVKHNKEKKFRSVSRSYYLGDSLITANLAGITIYQGPDSLTHPGMEFKYAKNRKQLKLIKGDGAFRNSKFLDTYHKMEIGADLVIWNLDRPEVNFSILRAKDQVAAEFESLDFYSDIRYQQLKGISSFHPLQMIVGYANKHKTDRFFAGDVAKENKIKDVAVLRSMAFLAREGYVDYNGTTGFVILKPKAYHYVNSARDKKDFDHIAIKSTAASGKNATLNLDKKELTIRGVKEFSFSSDSTAITVRPDSGVVHVKKNRDIDFAGRVITPNFIFKGSNFQFSYNDFWIDMPKIDSLIFRTKKPKKGKEKLEIAGGADQVAAPDGTKPTETADKKEKGKEEDLAQVDFPSDYPEDDSVKIKKALAVKAEKKRIKEEKKKAKKLAREKKKAERNKKPKLDEWGDPIEEEPVVAAADAPKPVVKKPKPKIPTEKALTGLNGKLYLNKPSNKSGRKKIGGYPYFDAATGATVYFNKDDVLGGVYDSTVYFTIPPFKLDSISSSSQTAVNFKGTFHSGNIFPPIETALTVMPDQSLGFEYVIPGKGFPIYGNKGNFASVIRLDGNGIQGKGSINYLTTNIKADTFTFYLDSVSTTSGISGAIAENSNFPAATIGKYAMNWHVSADKMTLNRPDSLFNKETMDPMTFYNGKYTYTGQATITPNGILGHGIAESEETRVKSPSFEFRQNTFKGNNADFIIKTNNPDQPALLAKDVFLKFDLQKGEADFSPERAGFASTELPYSQFKTSLSGGKWDFKKKLVTMKEPETNEPGNAFFVSTRADQDTLKFYATSGNYDLNTYTLIAGGVPFIASNDAHIVPDKGVVEITEGADIKVLQNSKVVLDSLNKFHNLVAGEIDVMSRKDFQGFATLEYENSMGAKYPIKFGSFTRDSAIVEKGEPPVFFTKALGSVLEDQKFYILPKILYRGDVLMESNKQQLFFDGEMKLAFSGDASASDWFPYKNTVNPDSVSITIKKMTTEDGQPLMTGLHVSNNSSRIYSTFVSAKADELDLDVFTVEGVLSYDRNSQEFKLSSPSKAVEESYEGNVIHYNDVTSVAKYEGSFNLIKSNKDFKLQTSGQATARMDSSRVNLDAFMAFDINLPGAAWTQMGNFIADNTAGAPEAVGSSNALLFKLGEFIGTKGVNDYLNRTVAKYVPFPEVSPKLVHNLVFNDVKLKWSKKTNSWYSVGPIGLANINKKDINAMVVGHIEIRRMGESDVVTIYIEANPSTWYYFNYNENALIVASSDDKFNSILAPKLKPPGTLAMTFTPVAGEAIDRSTFVKYFRNTYLGGKGDPLIDTPPPVQIADEPTEEPAAKKTKKKKKDEEVTEEPTDGFADTPPTEEPAAKKKKKSKEKTDDDGFGTETPVETPAEPAPAVEKKKKTKEKVEEDGFGTEPPVETKKKTKEKTEEPPADTPPPAEEEPPAKKKKEKKPKKGQEEEDSEADFVP